MVLLIDNYDSFSYNLFQLVGGIDPEIRVIRNDAMTCEEIEAMGPSHIILSPGPGRPADAGICEEAVRHFQGKVPILGVCLGHQAICEVYGGTVGYARQLMHGKMSYVEVDTESRMFSGMKEQVEAARYHSLALVPETLPQVLKVTGRTADGEIMAVEHREYPVFGLQFHPESILTPDGEQMVRNFLSVG